MVPLPAAFGGFAVRRRLRQLTVGLLAAIIVASGLTIVPATVVPDTSASAADGSNFDPGMIISDAVFYDSTTMTAAQIQSFLNARVPSCRIGYVCLKDYRQNTTNQPARSEGCAAYAGRANETAAQIISKVATACGINPRALIVLIEKEQGLISDDWPTSRQYRSATGYGCPDTADCDTNYYGFFNQVYHASWQFKKYRANPGIRQYQAGRNNTILWHPNASCGSSSVYIKNQATAGLYIYTPYRPNTAALRNLYGTGDSCSSYGNRNFWRMFTDWFGSTSTPAEVDVETNEIPLVYGVDAAGDLWLYLGSGAGGWRQNVKIGKGWSSFKHVTGAGDLNGDGHRDVLAVDSAGTLWIYPMNGKGKFLDRIKVGDGYDNVTAIIDAGDFNSDGTPDFFTRLPNGELRLHAGNGTGQFAPPKRVGTGWSGMTALVGGIDFDGDGRTDLLARTAGGELRIYPGNGRSGWGMQRVIGRGWSGMTAMITPGDFDGDGNADVLARDESGALWLYPGNGGGGWKAAKKVGSGWNGMKIIAGPGGEVSSRFTPLGGMGDLSGDGPADILARRASDGQTFVYGGNGRGGFATRTAVSDDWAGATAVVAAGDLDRDGLRDVLVRDGAGTLWRYPANGSGGFRDRIQIGTGWGGFTAIVSGADFSGDGNIDLLGRNSAGELWMYRGDGRGNFPSKVMIGSGWGSVSWIMAPGDFDGDGKPDLLAVLPSGDFRLYRGNGAGGFSSVSIIGTGWQTMTWVMTPGDFDGDHIPDVLARNAAGESVLYPGNGKGGWKPPFTRNGTGWNGMDLIG